MGLGRREFLGATLNAAVLAMAPGVSIAKPFLVKKQQASSPINVILPRDYVPPSDEQKQGYSFKLARATLDFLEEHYGDGRLPIWHRPFRSIDMEKRIVNVVYWVMQGVQKYQKIYPVDPAWIVAQILHESYFCEFAVSKALAVGICQFIRPTAHEYKMLCGGDLPDHKRSKQ